MAMPPNNEMFETVLPSQDAVSMRVRENGELIIEQSSDGRAEADTIVVASQNIDAFIQAIQRLCNK